MKKFLTTVVLITSLLVFGCAEDSGVNPLETEISTQMNKSFIDFTTGMSVEGKGGTKGNNGNGNNGNPNQDGYSSYGTIHSEEVTVNGNAGRKIRFSKNITISPTIKYKMTVELSVPKGAFSGTKTFTVNFNFPDLSVELTPTPFTFDIPLDLNLKYNGLDLSDFDENELSFCYLADDNQLHPVDYKAIGVDKLEGEIVLMHAKLPHFSRYGFVK